MHFYSRWLLFSKAESRKNLATGVLTAGLCNTDVSSISVKVYLPCSINHSSKVLPLVQLSFRHWKPLTYFQRYFQLKFVNLTQGVAKSPSETFAQAGNLSDLHCKSRLKPCKELVNLQCLFREPPKTKQECLLQHYSTILCCAAAQAKITLLWTKRVEPTRTYRTTLGNEEASGLSES